jgi:hypothetical protein
VLLEPEQLRLPLYLHPQRVKSFDQQSLMGVLRKDQRKGIWA